MDPLKTPKVDGIHAIFYQMKCDVVGQSVCDFVKNIQSGGNLKGWLNHTLFVLIPKVDSLFQFRPISLCTVLYKIVTNTIVNRLKLLIQKWVLLNQSSFVPGQSITDNIVVAQDIIHSMRSKDGKKGWMAVKIDMEKAYARLDWSFIAETLNDIGIPGNLQHLIVHCINSSIMQVLWNGNLAKVFTPSRDIRQGDPTLYLCSLYEAISSDYQCGS